MVIIYIFKITETFIIECPCCCSSQDYTCSLGVYMYACVIVGGVSTLLVFFLFYSHMILGGGVLSRGWCWCWIGYSSNTARNLILHIAAGSMHDRRASCGSENVIALRIVWMILLLCRATNAQLLYSGHYTTRRTLPPRHAFRRLV